jgi:hypothetical protein
VLLGYIAAGSLFSLTSAPFWSWLWLWVGALAVARTGVGAVAKAWAMAKTVTGTMAVAWAMAATVAVTVARDDLLKSFSKLQTFLILAGISFGGLGLGWLVGAGLRLMGVALPAK